jgi:bifunctional DNA-binding transcriptional regulator/antitoxin component of YhaV-PrlF toxin-antitoxin module
MAMNDTVETADATVYDEDGRTRIPDKIREVMDLEAGDKIKFVVIAGETRLIKRDE